MFDVRKGAVVLAKLTPSPMIREETTVAVIEAVSKGIREPMVRLKSRISKQNNTPARGALNMPAMAAIAIRWEMNAAADRKTAIWVMACPRARDSSGSVCRI